MKNKIIAIVAVVGVSLIVLVFLHKQSHQRWGSDRDNRMSRGDVFDVIDTDDDDKISIQELSAFIRTNHRLLDLNEDGGVDKSEMKNIRSLLKNKE